MRGLVFYCALASAFASSAQNQGQEKLDIMRVITRDGRTFDFDVEQIEYGTHTLIDTTVNIKGATVSGSVGGFEYVDLGLPSGTKWATCNVGASIPEGLGGFYAWAETQTKKIYDWSTYKYLNTPRYEIPWQDYITKYTIPDPPSMLGVYPEEIWYNDGVFVGDNKFELEPSDDAAYVNMGKDWRTPTYAEFKELIDNTTYTDVKDYGGEGIHVRVFKSKINQNTIVFPSVFYGHYLSWQASDICTYMISTLHSYTPKCNGYGFIAGVDWTGQTGLETGSGRDRPHSVRAVTKKTGNTNVMSIKTSSSTVNFVISDIQEIQFIQGDEIVGVSESGKVGDYPYVDLGLPSGIKWATYDVGASSIREKGDYYSWGEVETKSDYSYKTYKWLDASLSSEWGPMFSKYCRSDNTYSLDPEDDVAAVVWGSSWRMPTSDELEELYNGCDWEYVTAYEGRYWKGFIGTSKRNHNTIFIPLAGYMDSSRIPLGDQECLLRSSDIRKDEMMGDSYSAPYAIYFKGATDFVKEESSYPSRVTYPRYYGAPVRAVSK